MFCLLLTLPTFWSSVSFAASSSDDKLKDFISYIEQQNNIPSGLLLSIANIESDLKPFALNIEGVAVFPRSYKEAVSLAARAISSGVNNIDMGVMQINYRWHGNEFASIKEMIHPKSNIKYAGKLLSNLYKRHGDWHKAIRYYHSANSVYHLRYSRKITLEWLRHV